jgi:hypothetical protein
MHMTFERSGESSRDRVEDSHKHEPSNAQLEAWSGKSSGPSKSEAPDTTNAVHPDSRGELWGRNIPNILDGKYKNSDADIVNNANNLQALQEKYPHWYSYMSQADRNKFADAQKTADVDTYRITHDASAVDHSRSSSDLARTRLNLLSELTSDKDPRVLNAKVKDLVNLGLGKATYSKDGKLTDLEITGATYGDASVYNETDFRDPPMVDNLLHPVHIDFQHGTIDGMSKTQLETEAKKGMVEHATELQSAIDHEGLLGKVFGDKNVDQLMAQAKQDTSDINQAAFKALMGQDAGEKARGMKELLQSFGPAGSPQLEAQISDLVNLGMAKRTPNGIQITSIEPFVDSGTNRQFGSQKATPPIDIDFTHRTVNGTSEQELTKQGAAYPSEDWVKQTADRLLRDAGDSNLLQKDFREIEDMSGGIFDGFNKGLPIWTDGEGARWAALGKAIKAAGGELSVGPVSWNMGSINGRFTLQAPPVYTRTIGLTPPGGKPVYVHENARDYPTPGRQD